MSNSSRVISHSQARYTHLHDRSCSDSIPRFTYLLPDCAMAEETHAASSLAPLAESDSKPEDQQPEGNGKVMDATEKEHTPRVSEEAAMDTEDGKRAVSNLPSMFWCEANI